jgi:hypothetical protein
MGMDVDDPGAGVRWSVRFRGIEVSADVDTIRDALLDTSNALVPNTMSEKAHDALAALDRLAAAEAQRDEAEKRLHLILSTIYSTHGFIVDGEIDTAAKFRAIERLARFDWNADGTSAAVAPTEAKP